jgi:putative cardiolipin synthase
MAEHASIGILSFLPDLLPIRANVLQSRPTPADRLQVTIKQRLTRAVATRLALLLVSLMGVGSEQLATIRADCVRILHCDCDSLATRVKMIREAECEINLASYIIADDKEPLIILSLLRDAARRGVQVRILVDGKSDNNLMPRALQACLIRSGVQIREFHPCLWYRPNWMKHRLHDKLLIVDGRQLITGGRNQKDEYFGLDCPNFVDRDVWIEGCAAVASQKYFMGRWTSQDVRPPDLSKPKPEKAQQMLAHPELDVNCDEAAIGRAEELLDNAQLICEQCLCPLVCCAGHVWAGPLESCVRFLHDVPGTRKRAEPGIADSMLDLLASARSTILLETPYAVFSHDMRVVLKDARARGVQITLLTNSAAANNHPAAEAAYMNQRCWILNQGIQVWELTGPDCLHAKAAVIDGAIAVIGSYNFDILSEQKNSEVAVAIDRPEIAMALRSSIEVHMSLADRIDADGYPLGSDTKYPGVDAKKMREIRQRRLIAPFVKGYL